MEAMDRRLREQTGDPQGADPGERQGQEAGQEGRAEGQQGQAGQTRGGEQPGQDRPGQGGGRPDGTQGEAAAARDAGSPFAGGATRGDPRRLTDEEVRQFRREFLEREGDVRDLRDRLVAAGQEAGDLTAVLEAMRRLQRDPIYANPSQVAGLQDEILQALKRLEFGLRREVEGPTERRAALAGSDDVPDEYRRLVEEYYRKLAGSGGRDPGGR